MPRSDKRASSIVLNISMFSGNSWQNIDFLVSSVFFSFSICISEFFPALRNAPLAFYFFIECRDRLRYERALSFSSFNILRKNLQRISIFLFLEILWPFQFGNRNSASNLLCKRIIIFCFLYQMPRSVKIRAISTVL